PSISQGWYLPPSECLLIWPHHLSVGAAFRLRIHPSAISVCLPLPPIPLISSAILFYSYLSSLPPFFLSLSLSLSLSVSLPSSLTPSLSLFLSLPLFSLCLHSLSLSLTTAHTFIHTVIHFYTKILTEMNCHHLYPTPGLHTCTHTLTWPCSVAD